MANPTLIKTGWCIPRLFAVCMAIFCFINQMAIHNTTKLLPLRSQIKPDPNRNTNPNRHSNSNIFTCTSLTPIKRFYRIYERNFCAEVRNSVRVWGNVCTTQQLHYQFADVAVLSSENTSDNKSIVHTLSLKEGFLWGISKGG